MATIFENKIPPHSLDAEKAVLGAMLLDNKKIVEAIKILDADCFYEKKHKDIFKIIVSLYQENKVADFILLADELKNTAQLEQIGGISYLTELINSVDSTENINVHARLIKEKSILRAIISNANLIISSSYDDGDLGEILEKAESLLSQARDNSGAIESSAMDLKELLESNIPPVEYYVEDILMKKGRLIVSAAMNSCKTFLAQNLALSLTSGKTKFLNKFNIEPARVYYLDLESGLSSLKGRLKSMVESENLEAKDFKIKYRQYINLLDKQWQIWLENELSKFGTQILILDAASEIWEGDENSDKDVRALCRYLDDLVNKFNLSIILIHHWRKKTKGFTTGAEMTSGSKKWLTWTDCLISLEGDNASSITVKCDKARNYPKFEPFILKLNPETLWLEFVTDFKQKYTEDTLVALFASVDTDNLGKVRLSELKKKAKADKICSYNTLTKLIAESVYFERKEVLKGKKKEVWIAKKPVAAALNAIEDAGTDDLS